MPTLQLVVHDAVFRLRRRVTTCTRYRRPCKYAALGSGKSDLRSRSKYTHTLICLCIIVISVLCCRVYSGILRTTGNLTRRGTYTRIHMCVSSCVCVKCNIYIYILLALSLQSREYSHLTNSFRDIVLGSRKWAFESFKLQSAALSKRARIILKAFRAPPHRHSCVFL